MTVELDECLFANDDVILSFRDSKCKSFTANGSITIETRLDECGTTVNANNETILFENRIEVHSRKSYLKITSDILLKTSCSFSNQRIKEEVFLSFDQNKLPQRSGGKSFTKSNKFHCSAI